MGKRIKSVSIDEDIAEAVDSDDSLNLSALVNQFLKNYFTTGDTHRSAIELRLEQIETEIEETEEKLDGLRRERERLETLLEREKAELEPLRQKAVDLFYGRGLEPTNPGVENWAVKMGMTPEELLDKVSEWADEDDGERTDSPENRTGVVNGEHH